MLKFKILHYKNLIDFKLNHFLVLGILIICFVISIILRSQVADYGFVLNETDPFYNFRATEFLVNQGFESYANWHDEKTWYPEGRDVFETSQVALHLTAAILYKVFGFGLSLLDFIIILPAVIGSITCVIVFALVRVFAGTTAGLFAGLFFSVSPLLILRGTLGWFKSEPLGLFYSLLAIYLLVSMLKNSNKKIGFSKSIIAGFFLGISFSAWGGSQFFIIPIGFLIISLPFFRKDYGYLLSTIPTFVATVVLFSSIFSRAGLDFLVQFGSFGLIGPAIFLVVLILIQKKSKKHFLRNSFIFLTVSMFLGILIMISGFFSMPNSIRYTIALNPFVEGGPLFETVGEHVTPTLEQSFATMSIFIPLAGLGIWFILKNGKNSFSLTLFRYREFIVFLLILGIFGAYIGAILSRLMVFSALVVVIFASIGLAILTKEAFKPNSKIALQKEKSLIFSVSIIMLLLFPLGFYPNLNWINITDNPPTILNGKSDFKFSTQDWFLAGEWIKLNTPQESIIAAWWDRGYWITTLSDRITLADNAALPRPSIQTLAKMFLSDQDTGYKILRELEADYVLVSVVGEKKVIEGREFYELKRGGDDVELINMIKISGEKPEKFLVQNIIPNQNFWENTVLGKLIPFSPLAIAQLVKDDNNDDEGRYTIFYEKKNKIDVESTGPFKLVYSSPGLNQHEGLFVGVLVYEINKEYKPIK